EAGHRRPQHQARPAGGPSALDDQSLTETNRRHIMAKRRSGKRKDVLDWWQAVLDETKDFVDDSIDRIRDDDDDDDLADEVDELKQAVAQLNAKLDRLLAAGTTATEPSQEVPLETPAKEGATT
ncbi:MAG: hypothetical protein ACRD0C_18675, partial [Acidimicrobiia bacterium]